MPSFTRLLSQSTADALSRSTVLPQVQLVLEKTTVREPKPGGPSPTSPGCRLRSLKEVGRLSRSIHCSQGVPAVVCTRSHLCLEARRLRALCPCHPVESRDAEITNCPSHTASPHTPLSSVKICAGRVGHNEGSLGS